MEIASGLPLNTVPPRPSLWLQLLSLLVISWCALLAGRLLAEIRTHSNPLVWYACLFLIFCISWVIWLQTLGTFRPHERWAREAGNWLIGWAAVTTIGVAALPLAAGQPLSANDVAQFGSLVVGLVFAGWRNIVWARHLRRTTAAQPTTWTFSIRELLVLTSAAAISLGAYAFSMRVAANQ